MENTKEMEIHAVIGFDGSTKNGLKCHPNGTHLVYPMGNKICIQDWTTKEMHFLNGHSNSITALDITKNGKYIGSGQKNRIGFRSMVILWNYDLRTIVAKHEYHMVRVESVIFSCDDSLMVSMGGQDCGQICVWNIHTNKALCTVIATKIITGDAYIMKSLNKKANTFISGGEDNLRIWRISSAAKFPAVSDINLGKLKRNIISMAIHHSDTYGYCGTSTGDIMKITFDCSNIKDETTTCLVTMVGCYAKIGVWKKNTPRPEVINYSLGVCCIIILDDETLLIGAGDGTVEHLQAIEWKKPLPKSKIFQPAEPQFRPVLKSKRINGCITSMQIMKTKKEEGMCLIGTDACEIYLLNLETFRSNLVIACHTASVNEIAFPHGYSEVFATASTDDVRIWCLKTCQELLRIRVANFICTALLFSYDGTLIYSGWEDGCVRVFTPLTGRLAFNIMNTHNKGTTALAITTDGKTLVSGGNEGQVRIWKITPQMQTLKSVLKEHKNPVSAIRINNTDTEAVSAGADGSCIIWDIIKQCRRQTMFVNTIFTCLCYEPTGSQILTVSTDRRVAYWEAGSGVMLRDVEASKSGEVNAIHINNSGKAFATGGTDQTIKLWSYDDGIYTHVGLGHSGAIKSIRFSPDGNYIVSGSKSGDIFIWKCPEEHLSSNVSSSAKSKFGKEENIRKIDTARCSVISTHSCSCKGSGLEGGSKIICCKCNKTHKPPPPASVTSTNSCTCKSSGSESGSKLYGSKSTCCKCDKKNKTF